MNSLYKLVDAVDSIPAWMVVAYATCVGATLAVFTFVGLP